MNYSTTTTRGFTFLEMIITLGILLVMTSALVSFFVSSNSTFVYDKAYVDTAGGAGAVMSAVVAAARPANQILASHTFSTGTYSSNATTLVLELPSIDSTGAVISGAYDYIAFYTSGTKVYRRIEANASSSRRTGTVLLATSLSSISFTYDNADLTQATRVTADVQTQSTAKGYTLSGHLTEQIFLRNVSS